MGPGLGSTVLAGAPPGQVQVVITRNFWSTLEVPVGVPASLRFVRDWTSCTTRKRRASQITWSSFAGKSPS